MGRPCDGRAHQTAGADAQERPVDVPSSVKTKAQVMRFAGSISRIELPGVNRPSR